LIGIIFWLSVLGIFYVYAGYPLVLTLLARLRLQTAPYKPETPSVTMLIAAHNEEDVIAAKLENSLDLDYPPDRLQILVADDGSDDSTVEIVQSLMPRGVELFCQPVRGGKMAVINRAVSQARHEILVFSDANNFYEESTLRELVRPFSDPEVGGVAGNKNVIKEDGVLDAADGLYWRYESYIKQQETRLGSCVGVSGEVFAIRRDLFESPPDSVINDDFILTLSIIQKGYRVVYVPQARSREFVSSNEQDEIVRRARIIAGRYQALVMSIRNLPYWRPLIVWQVVSHKYLRPLVPFMMIVAFLANMTTLIWKCPVKSLPLLFLLSPFNWLFFILQIVFYLLAWLGAHVTYRGSLGKLLYLPTFLVNSNYAALLGFYNYFTGEGTAIWKKVPRRRI